jgi:hypothetical protein
MKLTKCGKTYDLTNATLIHAWSNEKTQEDSDWERQTVYRDCNGTYFWHGQGGPMSAIRTWDDDGISAYGGEDFGEMVKVGAYWWLVTFDAPVEVIKRYFPVMPIEWPAGLSVNFDRPEPEGIWEKYCLHFAGKLIATVTLYPPEDDLLLEIHEVPGMTAKAREAFNNFMCVHENVLEVAKRVWKAHLVWLETCARVA